MGSDAGGEGMTDLDRKMAEVMGWTLKEGTHEYMWAPGHSDNITDLWWYDADGNVRYRKKDWHPQTNIKQAFEVVGVMRKNGYAFKLIASNSGGYKAEFALVTYGENPRWADTPEMAICLAAEKATEGK